MQKEIQSNAAWREMTEADKVPLMIVPAKTDAELANMHREKVLAALSSILPMLDAARKDGFEISFAMGPDFMGRISIQDREELLKKELA